MQMIYVCDFYVCVSHTALSVKAHFLALHSFIPTLQLSANTHRPTCCNKHTHTLTLSQYETYCGEWRENRVRRVTNGALILSMVVGFLCTSCLLQMMDFYVFFLLSV